MGATQTHTQRTEENRDGRHEVRDVDDDEIAGSYAGDGSHEKHV